MDSKSHNNGLDAVQTSVYFAICIKSSSAVIQVSKQSAFRKLTAFSVIDQAQVSIQFRSLAIQLLNAHLCSNHHLVGSSMGLSERCSQKQGCQLYYLRGSRHFSYTHLLCVSGFSSQLMVRIPVYSL